MNDNKLSEEQQKSIQEILRRFREEADVIVAQHRDRVKQILDDLDRQKAEEIQKMIGSGV
ncbi:MAG: hypothetical protein PHS79_00245 [Patescibacteria group bacterium]|nr:hypothetical protein [Patescibacteria group bacterium]